MTYDKRFESVGSRMMSDVKEFVQHVYKGHKKKRSLSIVFDWNIRILKSLSSEEECS